MRASAQAEGAALASEHVRAEWVGGQMQQRGFKFPSPCFRFLGKVILSPRLSVRTVEKVLDI